MPALLIAFLTCAHGLCTRHDLPFDGTTLQCAMFGQAEVARWLGEHPGHAWDGRWACLAAGQKET